MECMGLNDGASRCVARALMEMDPNGLIRYLDPVMRMRARLLVMGIALLGYGRARVASGRRTLDEQRRLYGKGRTKAECKRMAVPEEYAEPKSAAVTWTRPEKSKHVKGKGVDFDFGVYGMGPGAGVAEVAEILGLVWGGNWEVRDYGHFEM
jgi:hypothetical protein